MDSVTHFFISFSSSIFVLCICFEFLLFSPDIFRYFLHHDCVDSSLLLPRTFPAFLSLWIRNQCWNFITIFGDQELSRNWVVVPACQATWAGKIDSLELIHAFLRILRIPSHKVAVWAKARFKLSLPSA
jgi:hypothetical protein